MRLQVRVRGHRDLRRLAERLRAAADGQLERDAQTELVDAAPPVLAEVRAKVLGSSFPAAEPGRALGRRSTGLRARLADATRTEPLHAPVGVRFTVVGAVVEPDDPRGGHKLAKYTDTELAPRWRHQVFGDPDAWFNQLGDPWFFSTIRPAEPRFRAAVERAMSRTARRIMGG
jgi:hypothetical protein